MGDSFALISENELREKLASWIMKNSRFAPQPKSCGEAAFIQTFSIPETDFELVSNAIGDNEKVISLFKTQVTLKSWQTRNGEEKRFVYCKAMETDVDSLGNTFSSISGYGIIKFD
ncbi:MAG: hypothetical protein IJF40_05430 [Clostridia bacterium]|nr:hypothetical protein [Clostridia bacterium]